MNPNSSYDLLYKGLSESDRERLQKDVESALKKGTEEVQGLMTREVEKAVTSMYQQLMVNPWPSVVRENGNQYEFMEALRQSIWEAMKNCSPAQVSGFEMRELIKAWHEKFPDDWKKIVGDETAKEIATLREQLAFEVRLRRGH